MSRIHPSPPHTPAATCLSGVQYGILTGIAFLGLYVGTPAHGHALCGLPLPLPPPTTHFPALLAHAHDFCPSLPRFSFFALALAALPDRTNKRNLLALGVFLWSLASAVRR